MLRGVIEADHLFGLIYSLDLGDDWRNPDVWEKANPLLGITPKREWMQKYCSDAQQTPALEGEFKVKCCSLWLSSSTAWLHMDQWDKCADASLRREAFKGEPAWIGCDLAERDDLAAVAVVFKRDGTVYAFVTCYLPRDVVEERARGVPEYRRWATDGLLTMTEGNMIDYAVIERDLRSLCERFDVQGIVLERFGALNIAANLSNDGLPARIESKNAKVFTPPSLELEARVKAGKFRHDGNSLLKWAASNCVVDRRTDGTILPKKRTAESPDKVDPIDAILLALGELLAQPAPNRSAYDCDPKDFDVNSVFF
jgi:phage terminase large subunit-like protein